MHHIFINENEIDLLTNEITIDSSSENYKHLVKSLRIEKDENVLCSIYPFIHSFDYRARVFFIDNNLLKLSIEEKTIANELPVNINLYQGISKSDKFEFIIEKSVELGVHSITPLSTEYCVAKIEEKKSEKKIDRYNKISKSAAEQSKRHIIPRVYEPIDYKMMIKNISTKHCDENGNTIETYNILFYENAAGLVDTKRVINNILKNQNNNKDNKIEINVIIGPEGGFSENEIMFAKNANIDILSLGDRILRTETAAVTALSILMYEFNAII